MQHFENIKENIMQEQNKSIKFTEQDPYTREAMRIFDLEYYEVTARERNHAKAQAFARNYGYRGVPKRTYTIDESGTVEFI